MRVTNKPPVIDKYTGLFILTVLAAIAFIMCLAIIPENSHAPTQPEKCTIVVGPDRMVDKKNG